MLALVTFVAYEVGQHAHGTPADEAPLSTDVETVKTLQDIPTTPMSVDMPKAGVIKISARANMALGGGELSHLKALASKDKSTEHKCLSQAIYYEARGESRAGQLAVAQVVMNRVKSRKYPSTVCGVVFQRQVRNVCQFSFACDGSMNKRKNKRAWRRATDMAAQVLNGDVTSSPAAKATHFHTTYVSPSWSKRLVRVAKVGTHIFYRYPTRSERRKGRVVLAKAEAPKPILKKPTVTPPVAHFEPMPVLDQPAPKPDTVALNVSDISPVVLQAGGANTDLVKSAL